jgi:hypothetical protein
MVIPSIVRNTLNTRTILNGINTRKTKERQMLKSSIFLVGFAIIGFFLIAGPFIEAFGQNPTMSPPMPFMYIPYDCWGMDCKNIPFVVIDTKTNKAYEPPPYSKNGVPMCHDPLYEMGALGKTCHDEADDPLPDDNISEPDTPNFGIRPVPDTGREPQPPIAMGEEDRDEISDEMIDENDTPEIEPEDTEESPNEDEDEGEGEDSTNDEAEESTETSNDSE